VGNETVPESEPPVKPRPIDELPPETLVDRYQIEYRLGAGGMGVVYAARDIHLGRLVAIKLVGSRIESESGHARLVREAQAMAKLRHPNLAVVHDIGASADRLFVVMELVDGGTLADWLRERPRTWREIVGVYVQAARGLAAAHAAGFVHRDFKPENVLYGSDGVPRVSDFGVAALRGETESGVVGTPGYIAPEILHHAPADERADQFSFCVALYAALYGRRPSAGEQAAPGGAPRWLARIITRGLAVDPGARWPSINALVAAIERRTSRRRVRTIAALAAAVAIVAMIVLVRRQHAPDAALWSPVVIGRERSDAPLGMTVSADGSTVAGIGVTDAWVEPRAGGGARRHVTLAFARGVAQCRLSRTGQQLVCSFDRDGRFEIWSHDIATNQPRRIALGDAPILQVFDLGADGSILFGARDLSAMFRAYPSGAIERLVTAGPAELVNGWTWSADGTRIAYRVRTADGARIDLLTLADRRVETVSNRICKDLEWLTSRSLVCVPRAFRTPLVIELRLPAGGGRATEHVRYNGPEYHQVSQLSTSAAGVLLSTSPNDKHLALVTLASGELRRITSGGVTDLPAVGWTTSGRLIFGASAQGHLRIMAVARDGTVETVRTGSVAEVPLAVFGETVVFGRFAGGERTIPFFETPHGRRYPPHGELFRLDLATGAVTSLGATRNFSALLCGDHTCLLSERAGNEAIAIDWDPLTGTRGRERVRWLMTTYASTGALSPDGRMLAQVQRVLGRGALSVLDLANGQRRRIDASDAPLDFPRWQGATLLALRTTGDTRGIIRVETRELLAAVPAEPLTIAEDLQLGEGMAAVLMTESLQTHWWIPSQPAE
jgi:hypothetical protein